MNIMFEEDINKQIKMHYEEHKKGLKKTVEDFENFVYKQYIQQYWYRVKSKRYLRDFLFELKKMKLMPTYSEYRDICKQSELFSTALVYVVRIGRNKMVFGIPLIINVSELTKHLIEQQNKKGSYLIEDLSQLVVSDYWNDFERDALITMQRRDILYEERKNNPIIVLNKSEVNNYTLLNGNHRVMGLKLSNKKEKIEAYSVNINECIRFALTDDYEVLYKNLLSIRQVVRGSMLL